MIRPIHKMPNTALSDSYNIDNTLSAEAGLVDFWKILRIVQRWWWLIGFIVGLLTAITAIILFRVTPLYLASSVLEVKQEERKIVDVSEVESIVVDKEFLSTQLELLQSERLIGDTINSLNLMSDPFLAPLEDEEWLEGPPEKKFQSLIFNFKQQLSVAPIGRTRLIRVRFEHADPVKAALIANTVTENYIANGLSRKFNTTAFAREFLEDRLRTVKISLEEAERKLVSYANNNNIIIIDEGNSEESSGSLDKTALKTLNEQLTEASVDRVEAEIIYQQSQVSSHSAAILNNDSLSRLKSQRLALNSEYQERLAIFKPAYPEMLELREQINLFDKEIEQEERAITSLSETSIKNAYDLAIAKEQDLVKRVNALKNVVLDVREKSIDYNILKRQVETERTQYEALLQRLKEVSISDDFGSNLVEVVDEATPPLRPYKPNRLRTLVLSLIISGFAGFGAAYIVDLIDDRVKAPEDIKKKLQQITMGVIPLIKNEDELLEELKDPQSGISEAYSSLRTNLQFSGENGGPRVIQITSTRSGEGKSVSSLGTALRFAGIGHNVLLIDGDMRRPTFKLSYEHKSSKSIGLSGVLTQNVDFASHVQQTQIEGLSLLPSGPQVPNPSELLASNRFNELLAWAKEAYDYIVVDSPPVLGLADAPIIGAKVSATLLVVDSGTLRTPNIKGSIERLGYSGTKILGVVLTKYKSQSKGYMNYYQYTYGSKATSYGGDVNVKSKKSVPKRKFDLT